MAKTVLDRINKRADSRKGGLGASLNLSVLIAWAALLAYGAFVIWTASLTMPEASLPRQLLGMGIGVALAAACWRFDFSILDGLAVPLLVIDVLVMFTPYIPGLSYTGGLGMTGWIKIPGIGLTFQPVELAKLITIFMLASLGAQYNGRIDTIRDYIKLCSMLFIAFGAAVVAGDLGSGLVIFFSGAVIIMMSGPRKEWVLCTIALLVGGVSLILALDSVLDGLLGHDVLLKQYQMNRLLVFINPEANTSEEGYNLMQSLIAVGSGGFFGKGIRGASQSASGFLPEAQTDFVFAMLAEEFGFVGCLLLLVLFAALLFSTIRVAYRTNSLFMKLVAVGIVGMWLFQILEEIGMCIGMMPITGIPLPFISFGSSSMIMQCAAVGIVQSVWRTRGASV